jgi:hypothetical protein
MSKFNKVLIAIIVLFTYFHGGSRILLGSVANATEVVDMGEGGTVH